MKTRKQIFVKSALILAIIGCSATITAQAETKTITSPEFSIGYGFVPKSDNTGQWSVEETEASNTLPGKGFGVTMEVEGGQLSATGVSFIGREARPVSSSNASGLVSNFLVTVSGSYDGKKPADAANNPKYKVKVNIKRISIYAAPTIANGSDTINFSETTYGNDQVQQPQEETAPATFATLSAWRQLEWVPTKNEGQTRTFELNQTGEGNPFAIDGLEVIGTVEVTYDVR